MSRKYFILLMTIVALIFTSCVSKKKFLEMQSGRVKAEKLVHRLNNENNAKATRIEALIADFETMKNELMESNAIKDQYIDSLNSEIFVLNEGLSKQKKSLQETSFTLDFEKQRLTNALASKDKAIKAMEAKMAQMESEIGAKSSVIDQKNFDMKLLNDKVAMLESQKKSGDQDLSKLQAEMEKVKAETAKLKSQLKEKEATITKLKNNVKLLKKELGH
ncbi:MAG: hypothetical protein J7L95_05300 [Prolixibacteraceae bacterium]|nr:hypothetical protein [Prolixibacteraceae bacterium]